MKVLAVDTSSIVATVAVAVSAIAENDDNAANDGKLIGQYVLNHGKTHSQKIMPMIEELLHDTGLKIGDIDVFAVANGPGSFTGLRIGAATIKGLAHAVNKPVVGISTLDGLAFNLPFCQHLISPIMDARREQVYNALYQWSGGTTQRITDYRAISVEELIEELMKRQEKVVFTGDGVPVFKGQLMKKLGSLCEFAPPNCSMQNAASIAALALKKAAMGEVESYMTFAPFYLRKSQAEREYEERCCKECQMR